MNRKTIISSLLLMAILPVSAQRLQVTRATVNCGPVAYNRPVTATFEMRNKGNRKLKITDVRTSCGCTAAEYPKKEIAAGDKFVMKLTYDARRLGHFDKSMRIVSNGNREPIYVNMTGVVMAELKDNAASYPFAMGDLLLDCNELEFDDVNKGENPVQDIHIMNVGSTVFTPTMMHLPPYLSAIVTPEQLSPGHSGKISVMLHSSKLHDYGLTQTSVYVASNLGETVSNDNELPVSAVLLPNFDGITEAQKQYGPKMLLSADSLDFVFEGKVKKNGQIVITNNGRTDLKISSLQMFTSGLKVTLGKRELKPGESTKLKITAMREELKKQRSKPRVLMITNDPDKAKVVIKINVRE